MGPDADMLALGTSPLPSEKPGGPNGVLSMTDILRRVARIQAFKNQEVNTNI